MLALYTFFHLASVNCTLDEFVCRSGTVLKPNNHCLPENQLCDGNDDCIRGTDEQNCPGMYVYVQSGIQ